MSIILTAISRERWTSIHKWIEGNQVPDLTRPVKTSCLLSNSFMPDCCSGDRNFISHSAVLKIKGITFCSVYSTPNCPRKGCSSASQLLCLPWEVRYCTTYSGTHNFWRTVDTYIFSLYCRLSGLVEALRNPPPTKRQKVAVFLAITCWLRQVFSSFNHEQSAVKMRSHCLCQKSLPWCCGCGPAPHHKLRSYHLLLLTPMTWNVIQPLAISHSCSTVFRSPSRCEHFKAILPAFWPTLTEKMCVSWREYIGILGHCNLQSNILVSAMDNLIVLRMPDYVKHQKSTYLKQLLYLHPIPFSRKPN